VADQISNLHLQHFQQPLAPENWTSIDKSTIEASSNMGSIGEPPSEPIMAQYRFGIPDNSGPITDRAMYAMPPSKKFDVIMPIHDVRTKPADYVDG
jgi:hypothetical protein